MQKIPVGILGATGMVGQKFVHLLKDHPWFAITALAASDRSCGKTYQEALTNPQVLDIPDHLANMRVSPCSPSLPCRMVFSGLDSSVAFAIESQFAENGYVVISNASSHRMTPLVPLLIPEVNPHHLQWILQQPYFPQGAILTNPNCSVIGIAMALQPLIDRFGVEACHAVTLQAVSGAGYPGTPSLDILDNVIPHISQEEHKVETEPLKIFATSSLTISAQCNRVAVTEGHLACLSIKLKKKAQAQELIEAWDSFQGEPQELKLPSAPEKPLFYLHHPYYPQPKLHRSLGRGMSVSIGRLQPCSLMDWKCVILSHNTIRGAAGCALLNAELLVSKGLIPHLTLQATAAVSAL